MKKGLLSYLYSTKLTAVLLLVFAIAIGAATFVENSYDTVTAQVLIYRARWFEVVILLLAINFLGNIGKYKLLRKEKFGSLLFHVGFLVVILGAGLTRYIGFEGIMPIREGETSNVMYSSEPYVQVYVTDQVKETPPINRLLYLTELTDNSFNIPIEFPGKGHIDISYKGYLKNGIEELEENVEGGSDILEIMLAGREAVQVKTGEVVQIGEMAVAYNNDSRTDAIRFSGDENDLKISSPYDIMSRNMLSLTVEDRQKTDLAFDTLYRDTVNTIGLRYLLFVEGAQLMVNKIYKNAKNIARESEEEGKGQQALIVNASYKGQNKELVLFGGKGRIPAPNMFKIDDLLFRLGYGAMPVEIPFSIRLDDFRLDKYPGTMSPSSFESDVTLIDERKGINESHSIFMNNVMDHDGYRFFQSSYDPDETGTVLSVNNDFWGTWVTYLGYIMLGLGFFVSLFVKKGRFRSLKEKLKSFRANRVAQLIAITFFASNIIGQDQFVDADHADKFGHLLVQNNGRFEPVHTLAFDVMHKISKRDKFEINGEKLDAMQVFLDMPINPYVWRNEKIIAIRGNTGVRELIGVEGKYASVNDFLIDSIGVVLKPEILEEIENSTRKKAGEQNAYDKELIKVNERFNVALMSMYGTLLKMFPVIGDENNTWVGVGDSLAYVPLSGSEHSMDNMSYARIFDGYLAELMQAKNTGEYKQADGLIKIIGELQRKGSEEGLLPSESLVETEISYNKSNIFKSLERTYALLALCLLITTLIQSVVEKSGKILNGVVWFLIVLLALTFAYHTYGLILRWRLTGHAPWSNGFEALTFIAWGGVLAGFLFIRSSKITLAATALLAFFTLMTAGHSSFDPQLTNLEPVLKSYWLIIHVAAITISYGFFGLSFILGLINLFIYLFKGINNHKRLTKVITELTYINEMVVIIGIVLATIGTFLGGVWANESWGRYWGWDAKETWALVIVLVYAVLLHLRFIPGRMRGLLTFNIFSVAAFSTVLMTFIGVNYYLSKGLHSYARGETPVFPMWAWITIFAVILLFVFAGIKEKSIVRRSALLEEEELT